MSSDAFKGQGRRLGSSSDPNTDETVGPHVNRLFPNDQATRSPSDPVSGTSLSQSNIARNSQQRSSASTASTVSPPTMALEPTGSASKKRKRRASTASTESLPKSAGVLPHAEMIAALVTKRLKGEEIIDLLTDEDRQRWCEWLNQQAGELDPLESLETWYYNYRTVNAANSRERQAIDGQQAQAPDSESRKAPLKEEADPAADSLAESTSENLPQRLTPMININSRSDAAPGVFRHPTVLKTWCFGYPRERDIKLEEILQRNHLSSVVASSFVWDLDFWWSKINKASTPCQFVIQRDQVQQGTRLQDGPNRIILHPENTKILHSKFMFLFFDEAEELRIVITTANMVAFDWGEMGGFMENMVFMIDLPKMSTKEDQDLTQFGIDFSEYCTSLGLSANIVNQFKNYDWEGTRDLIFIGTHGRVKQKELPYTGLAGLAQKLAQADLVHDGEIEIDYVASSIGKLNWEFLSYLYQACKGQQPLPTPAKCKNETNADELIKNIRVYFASQETIDSSKGGERNVSNLCFYPSNYYCLGEEKKVFHDCKSQRPGCAMHSKILFVQPKALDSSSKALDSGDAGPDTWFERTNWRSTTNERSTTTTSSADKNKFSGEIDSKTSRISRDNAVSSIRRSSTPWMYIGSANCSWAAWCNPRNCKKQEDGYNTGSNWECGVIIPVRVLQLGHGLGRLDVFSNIVPIPMRTDTEKLHPQSRIPFLAPS